ncbi:MAG: heat-inducible transcriptional repressor HrcA [Chloroflexi bacterium]|nr:heat-inducible transcriptional repressor HrcA [Chloroflexota bacterium]MQC16640.1 heat-inducible transcription repressor HrcA [Chloroflexota bacterium]MQC47580.1 heat-inducible transcription repressor HrcA [Chloroflexota bacterium]
MLTERQASILGMVVDEYVQTAEPVSSKALVSRRRLEVSTATIRNELARLETGGYITHPYTSAGRIPSDQGYRFYVEALMAEDPVGLEERRTVEHQLHQVAGDLDNWLSLTATILSSLVGNVAVVTRPRTTAARLRNAQLVELSREASLLVVVMDDGRLRQRILPLAEPVAQEALNDQALRLNQMFGGRDAAGIREEMVNLFDEVDLAVAENLVEILQEQRIAEETFVEGIDSALRQPEFADVDRILEAVAQLQAYRLRSILEPAVDAQLGSMRVIIGSENADSSMQDWSMIVARYGEADAAGAVAVVGPTRMAYQRTIPRVRYVASLMTQLLYEVRREP